MRPGLLSRPWRRRAWFGLQTVLGLRPRGFFSPYRYADQLPAPGERPAYGAIEAQMRALEPQFEQQLATAESYAERLATFNGPPPEPRWTQDWFPRLDAAIAYSVVRQRAPKRIVEVGSGHSTRILARAVADQGLDCAMTVIDPAPRADLAGLPVSFIGTALPAAGDGAFRDLESGDVLMIDSSHLLMPGSDVDFLFGHLLPILPPGLLLHVHDIFLPDDYPDDWAWRGYNEQLAVLPLIAGGGWDLLFASHYVVSRMAERLQASPLATLPLSPGAWESGLWLQKRDP